VYLCITKTSLKIASLTRRSEKSVSFLYKSNQYLRIFFFKSSSILMTDTYDIGYNGPVIKGGCVAERMEAGAVKPVRGNIALPAGMSEAWRSFCRLRPTKPSLTNEALAKLVAK
jgi:hypothetical protein